MNRLPKYLLGLATIILSITTAVLSHLAYKGDERRELHAHDLRLESRAMSEEEYLNKIGIQIRSEFLEIADLLDFSFDRGAGNLLFIFERGEAAERLSKIPPDKARQALVKINKLGIKLSSLNLSSDEEASYRPLLEFLTAIANKDISGLTASFQALSNDNSDVGAVMSLAQISSFTGSFTTIEKELQSLSQTVTDPKARSLIAMLYHGFDENDVALELLRTDIVNHPQSKLVRRAYAHVLSETGALTEAAKHLESLISMDSTNLDDYDRLITIYNRMGYYTRSSDLLDKAFKLDSTYPRFYYAAAETYQALGDEKRAKEMIHVLNTLGFDD